MNKRDIYLLKQPCANRKLDLIDNGDETITINGNTFLRATDAENYLRTIPRLDMSPAGLEILVEYPYDNKPRETIIEKYETFEEFQYMYAYYMTEPTVKLVEVI